MKITTLNFLLLLFFVTPYFNAQQYRETRAVWLTTNYKLDWPPNTLNEDEQKESLRNIFKDLSNKNFNTVYFQVRSNGSVLYNSAIEPFSPYLTGTVGVRTNYDPLQYAIDLGREYNLEVHAWVNMIRCFSGSDDKFLKHPKHVRNAHPDWTVRFMDENGSLSYWLNPGYYQVQDYLADLLNEIASNYDVDGIHLDFFRYPDKDFEDEKYFNRYGFNVTLDDWRRNNLTTILRKFKDKAKPLNPYLKIGATPIGIRTNLEGARGWEGYSTVFQDTETWLKEELVDYLTPQIYWGFEKNPKFDVLAKDWVDKSYNKNIVLGLAAYRNEVKPELQKMINFSREIGASGIAFFRYQNISLTNSDFFNDLVFPSNMAWKITNTSPEEKSIKADYNITADDEVLINWNDSGDLNSKIFRNFVLLDEFTPIKLLGLDQSKVKLKFGRPSKLMYNYFISKINRLWNHESLSNALNISVPYLAYLKQSSKINTRPIVYKQDLNFSLLLVHSTKSQKVIIETITKEDIGKQEFAELKLGENILAINTNLNELKTLRIVYIETNEKEEINFY
jgi:uncharacterized lipoprotein YddW (UPF0748 family)